MTQHRNGDETSSDGARACSDGGNPCGGRHRSRRHGEAGRYGRRKERVLHTRVSEQLSEDIRQLAEDLRVPVSNLVRNVLEEVFTVVENVSGDVGEFFEEVVEEADGIRERIRNQQRAHRESARENRRSRRTSRRRGARSYDAADIEDELQRDEEADAQPATASGPRPAVDSTQASPAEDVLGWQPIVLNRSISCARCDTELASGVNAMMGISSTGDRSQVVCPGCAARG